MNKTLYLIFICLLLCAGTRLVAQTFDYNRVSGHPRLLMKQGEEQQIRESLKDNPEMQRVYKQIVGEADRLLVCPTLTYKKEGRRLLAVSREALKRIFDLSFVYRMTGEDKYRLRAEQEMVSVCSFGDWNPSHFLDVGEMTMAVAIGYDWLFDKLSPETRRVVRESILQKGFAPSNDKQYNWFLKAENNWNQVCNTGLVYGALALLDSDSKEAAAVIERAMSSVPLSMKVYAPDGNYPEGYNYWGYGTSFNVMLIAALESALGSDGGLSAVEGFMSSARFMQYMAGTTGLAFNFSDARETTQSFPAMFWYASKLGDPSLLWNEKIFLTREDTHFTAEEERFLPIVLIYGSRFDMKEVTPPVSKIWTGHGKVPVALIRTGWDKGEGFYVGIKGGTASANHAHMDAGSFVFEAQGVRWAQDLGMQEYYSLEKKGVRLWNGNQDGQRWDVFRYNNFVHNTLTVNGEKHQVKGTVPILATYTKDARLGASLDMTSLFGSNLKKATREVVLVKERYLQVTDQVQAAGQPASVRWTMVTSATPKQLDSHTMELTKEGKKLHVIIDSPSAAAFSVVDNVPSHSYDAPNPGSVRIVFDVDVKAGRKETLKVRLVPVVEEYMNVPICRGTTIPVNGHIGMLQFLFVICRNSSS